MSMGCDTYLIKKIIEYSAALKDQIIVIKLSSIIIDDKELLDSFVHDIKLLSMCGVKLFIVHDYSNLIDKTVELFGLSKESYLSEINHEVSNIIVEMVLSGYINKYIVSKLCNSGVRAIGLSGKDGNFIIAKKSKKHFTDKNSIMYGGFLSEPLEISSEILLSNNDLNLAVVISPIANNENQNVNILEVDITTAMIATSIGADRLIILSGKNFLTENFIRITIKEELEDIISDLNLEHTIEYSIIKAAKYAMNNSDNIIHFGDATKKNSLISSIFHFTTY